MHIYDHIVSLCALRALVAECAPTPSSSGLDVNLPSSITTGNITSNSTVALPFDPARHPKINYRYRPLLPGYKQRFPIGQLGYALFDNIHQAWLNRNPQPLVQKNLQNYFFPNIRTKFALLEASRAEGWTSQILGWVCLDTVARLVKEGQAQPQASWELPTMVLVGAGLQTLGGLEMTNEPGPSNQSAPKESGMLDVSLLDSDARRVRAREVANSSQDSQEASMKNGGTIADPKITYLGTRQEFTVVSLIEVMDTALRNNIWNLDGWAPISQKRRLGDKIIIGPTSLGTMLSIEFLSFRSAALRREVSWGDVSVGLMNLGAQLVQDGKYAAFNAQIFNQRDGHDDPGPYLSVSMLGKAQVGAPANQTAATA
ncbi:uncharacterized protein KY384_004000 [Bacidia gigantensis]|uniref:uncharacterized protein n=1 Tax=Bacidia gigantensis TaxID=2732470 RepID=UPI001D0396E6|nr:uncharacterized protein KY384_004000 [Bacidia gigantensis]KAG8531288.1 hypothetical protein KY384_004000 [Bacidia gigantensis]